MFVRSSDISFHPYPRGQSRRWLGYHALLISAVVVPLLGGCSAISIPLGDVFAQKPSGLPTATVSSVPVTTVTRQALAPLPSQTSASEADPVTTGSIATPAIPYSPTRSSLTQSHPALANSGLASIPPAKLPSPVISADDLPLIGAGLATAHLDQDSAATLPWLNEANGHGGLIVPVASPVRQGDTICRAVVISIQPRGQPSEWIQANACRIGAGEWTLNDQRAWRNPV